MFSWHTEDMDLYSINYLHFGKPKRWYCVPSIQGEKFERAAANYFPGLKKECKAFLRHKTTMINPHILAKQDGIDVNTCVQEAGEFMITFPYAYHTGFNHGFNCAESVNFAQPDWINFGSKASRCQCTSGLCTIDMPLFIARYQLHTELGPNAILTDQMVLARLTQNKLESEQALQNKRKRPRNTTQNMYQTITSSQNIYQTHTWSQPKYRKTLSPTYSTDDQYDNDSEDAYGTDVDDDQYTDTDDYDEPEVYSAIKHRNVNTKADRPKVNGNTYAKVERSQKESNSSDQSNSDSGLSNNGDGAGPRRLVVQPGSILSCTLLGPHKILISVKKAINV